MRNIDKILGLNGESIAFVTQSYGGDRVFVQPLNLLQAWYVHN